MDEMNMLEAIKDEEVRKDIVCRSVYFSLIAITQEINSTIYFLKDAGLTDTDFYNRIATLGPPEILQKLAEIHGNNLISVSKQLKKVIENLPSLSEAESERCENFLSTIGDKFRKNDDTIINKMLTLCIDGYKQK